MPLSESIASIDASVQRILLLANTRKAEQARAASTGIRLSPNAQKVIHYLSEHGDSTLRDIADHYQLDHAAVSRQASDLAAKGYIKKVVNPQDARARQLSITAKGKKAYTKLRAAADELIVDMYREWPAEDVRELARLLDKMVQSMYALDTRL